MTKFPLSEVSNRYTIDMQEQRSWWQLEKAGRSIQPTLPYLSVGQWLESAAAQYENKIAMQFVDIDSTDTHGFEHLTYQNLHLLVRQIATFLQQKYKLQQGDAIGLYLHNHPLILVLHLAAWGMGWITVPLDLLRDDIQRKAYKLRTAQAKLLITAPTQQEVKLATEVQHLSEQLPTLHVMESTALMEAVGSISEKNLVDLSQPFVLDQTGLLLFTSGTTALPKGVQLSAANIWLNAEGIAEWLRIVTDDVMLVVLPLHHINSTTFCMTLLLQGGTIVLASRYTKSRFWSLMAQYECTLSSIVPTICFDLLSEQDSFAAVQSQLHQVKRMQIGSAPVQPSDVQKFHDLYHIPLVQGYGSTETALRVAGQPYPIDSAEQTWLVNHNVIGEALQWNELQVMDSQTGKFALEHEVGELVVRGPVLTQGYWQLPKENETAFAGGWFHTGDLGFWVKRNDRQLFCTTGRHKEIIIKGGVNISPLAIEDAILRTHPEVETCYVVGIYDPRYGENIAAVVCLKAELSVEQKKAVLAAISHTPALQAYERPALVLEVPLTRLPKTSTGKVQRVQIKAYLDWQIRPIAQVAGRIFRRLSPFDTIELQIASRIHEQRWGFHLRWSEEKLIHAAAQGIVLGVIDQVSGQCLGSLCALQSSGSWVSQVSRPEQVPTEWRTYGRVTSELTLARHQDKGSSLWLVAVSVQGDLKRSQSSMVEALTPTQQRWADEHIQDYIRHHLDPVLGFHERVKGGLHQGAVVRLVLPQARPEDTEAAGYCVVMEYAMTEGVQITPQASIGQQLVEAALLYAAQQGLHSVFAYSRPAGLAQWVHKNISHE